MTLYQSAGIHTCGLNHIGDASSHISRIPSPFIFSITASTSYSCVSPILANLNLLVCCICHNYDIPVHSPARFFQDFPRNIFLHRKRLSIPITTLSTINRMIRSAISLSIWTVASTILITNLDVISIIKTVVIINIAFFICGILHSTILQCWQ